MRAHTLTLSLLVAPAAAFDVAYGDGDTSAGVLRAPDSTAMRLWPSATGVPGERPGAFGPRSYTCNTPNVSIPECTDVSVHNITDPTITPYLVAGADAAVVVAPGGAYTHLAVDREGSDIAHWLNSIGVSAFVLEYRVPERAWLPFGAAPLMDAQRAMGLVRQLAADGKFPTIKLNTSKLGFLGFSAGAHLTGHLSVGFKTRAYAKIDRADDVSCRPDFAMMIYPWRSVSQEPVDEPISGASALNVTSETPPTMLVQTEDDPVHSENSIFYYMALKQAKAPPSALHVYPGGGHGYGRCTLCCTDYGEVCSWPDRALEFLRTLGVVKP